jgi:hypothetical protein
LGYYCLTVFFWEVQITAVIMPIFFLGLTKPIILGVIFGNFFFLIILSRIMSASSSRCIVQQRTEEGNATSRAKIANRPVIPEWNVVKANVMVTPLDFIREII